MADVAVKCVLELDNGAVIADMESTIAEGAYAEVFTSTRYATSAQSLGGLTPCTLVTAEHPEGRELVRERTSASAPSIPQATP